ncbi:MAG: hypothetical protein Fur0012_00640 [Elusimicrobiota bacterium]
MKYNRKTGARKLTFTAILALVFLFAFSRTFYKLALNLWEYYKARRELSIETQKNLMLKEENLKVRQNDFLEYSARTKLGLKKENEIEYRFSPPVKEKK